MRTNSSPGDYLLGHSDQELDRLAHQAELFDEDTKALLRAAGIRPGMRVLDLGCGVGDVSMIAADLVGPTGQVLAIDRSDPPLAAGRKRAESRQLDWIRFARQDINDLSESELRFDAIVGRFILLHFTEPERILSRAKHLLNAGGVMAFAEMDIRSAAVAPSFPQFETCMGWIIKLYEKSGLNPDSGSQLYRTFKAAGMKPELRATCRIEGGTDLHGLNYVLATIQTMQPTLIALGIASEGELDIELLRTRLSQDIARGDHCVIYPRLIGAWARPNRQ